MTFFIVVFLLLMQFLWKYIDDLAGKGLELHVLGELMFYVAASLVPLALPLAVLLASLMTMGNLGEHFELTAMKASGISLPRIVAPLIYISLFLTVTAFLFSNYVLPKTNLKMGSLLYDITNKRPELQIREGIFYNGIDDFSIRIGKKDYKTNMLYDLKIYDHTQQNGNTSVTIADSGLMKMTQDKKYLIITLFNGFNYSDVTKTQNRNQYNENTYPFRRDKFAKQEIRKELIGFKLSRTDENLFRQNYRMLSLRQLRHQSDSLKKTISGKSQVLKMDLIPSVLLRFRNNLKDGTSHRGTNPNDSTKKANIAHYTNFETVLNNITIEERRSLTDNTINNVRSAKSNISSSASNFDGQIRLIRRHDIEWWKKFTLSVSCLIFFLIGAPLGAIIRRGGLGMPVVISVLFFVLWYVLSLSTEKMVREGIVSSASGMWAASILLFIIGIFLIRKATLDSTIFNVEIYLNFFKKIINFVLPRKLKLKADPIATK
jgi:lipopolysaccharide export system permease protein